jgi:hypothetical protein
VEAAARVHVFEDADGHWWGTWVCKAWVSASNATRRDAEQSFGRHLQIAKVVKKAAS